MAAAVGERSDLRLERALRGLLPPLLLLRRQHQPCEPALRGAAASWKAAPFRVPKVIPQPPAGCSPGRGAPVELRTRTSQWTGRALLLGLLLATAHGCARVPIEAVLLSRTIGDDLAAIQTTQRSLVRRHFSHLRAQVDDYLHRRWKPLYLREFIERGELVSLAGAKNPVEAFEGVQDWVEIALEEIAAKRDSLLAPIDRQEDMLLTAVDEAFARLLTANAAVTAHLSSLEKVQTAQDRTLDDLRLKELRDRVSQGLIAASDTTRTILERVTRDRERLERLVKSRGRNP